MSVKTKKRISASEWENKLFSMSNKIFAPKNKKTSLEDYIKQRKDVKKINDELEVLSEKNDVSKEEIELLKHERKILEDDLLIIEESFYDESKGLWLGVAIDLNNIDKGHKLLYLEWKKLHNHFVVYGTSGYGKTRLFAIIMRQIIKFGWNVFAVDPKVGEEQEIARWMYEFALKNGYQDKMMRIIVSHPSVSDRTNPIFGMDDEEVASLCKSLSQSGGGVESASEKYFSGQMYRIPFAILRCMRFLEKIIYYGNEDGLFQEIVKEAEKYRNFKEIVDYDIDYEDEKIILPDDAKVIVNPKEKKESTNGLMLYNRTLVTFKELAYYGQFIHLEELKNAVDTYPIPSIENAKELSEFKHLKLEASGSITPLIEMGADRYNAVGDTFSVFMGQLAYGNIGKILTSIRVNPLRFKMSKDRVMVLMEPAPMKYEAISEMMMKIFIRMFISMFGEIGASGRKFKHRAALLVDEAKPMVFPGIEELYNKARSLGMTIGAFYQSKSDAKLKLGETLADIVEDNTATQIFMKQVSHKSQVEVAESFGTSKTAVNVFMGSIDTGGGRSTVIHEDKATVQAQHVDELQIGEAYIRHYGKRYFVKFPYQSDPDDTIKIEMPELESEMLFNQIAEIEDIIKDNLSNINEKVKDIVDD